MELDDSAENEVCGYFKNISEKISCARKRNWPEIHSPKTFVTEFQI